MNMLKQSSMENLAEAAKAIEAKIAASKMHGN
jgi:hypothetical protein